MELHGKSNYSRLLCAFIQIHVQSRFFFLDSASSRAGFSHLFGIVACWEEKYSCKMGRFSPQCVRIVETPHHGVREEIRIKKSFMQPFPHTDFLACCQLSVCPSSTSDSCLGRSRRLVAFVGKSPPSHSFGQPWNIGMERRRAFGRPITPFLIDNTARMVMLAN